VRHFKHLEDPGRPVNLLHPLDQCSVIADHGSARRSQWTHGHRQVGQYESEVLLKLLTSPLAFLRRMFSAAFWPTLKPDAFQACFTMWLTATACRSGNGHGLERPTLAIDGKTLRRSHDRSRIWGLHSVSVWASEFGLTLAQVATEEKSNEITAIPTCCRFRYPGAIIP